MISVERNPIERRRYPRKDALHLLNYHPIEDGVQTEGLLMAKSLNISEGGLGLEVYRPIEIGVGMEIEIAIGNEIFPLQGKVVYTQKLTNWKYRIGVSFYRETKEILRSLY